MPDLRRIRGVDRIKKADDTNVNKKELEMWRIEPLWSLSGTHTLIFNAIVKFSNRSTL